MAADSILLVEDEPEIREMLSFSLVRAGFDAGIDDYAVKPFSPKELIARVKSLLRRTGNPADGKITAGSIEMDTRAHRVR